jgi:hypothetical protein
VSKRTKILLGIGVIAALVVALQVAAYAASLAGSNFEIDTNANLKVDNAAPSIDWLAGGSGTSFRSGVLVKNDKPTGANDDSFGKGTAENNPNPTIVDGSIPPNKSDLKAFGVFTEQGTPPNDFLELFWSRVQNPSGTTNMDFELNQKFCDLNATPTNCADNGGEFPAETPIRTSGDKLITYDLSKGGTVPTISIRTWNGSVWGNATVISGGQNPSALGSVNTSLLAATDTGGLGSQDAFTFGEAAISFQALFGTGGCGSFGSAYLKSRSSDSFTSEIKDFVGPQKVTISNCPSSLTTTATQSVTLGQPISDTAHLTVPAGSGGTITFHLWSNATCTAEVTTGLTPVTVSGPGDYNSGNFTPTTAGTYYWTAVYSGAGTTNGSSTACGDAGETSTVTTVAPGMTTAQSFVPNDSATVTATGGGALAGSVHFQAYKTSDCTGATFIDQTKPVSGASPQTVSTTNTTALTTTTANISWLVSYDSTNPGQDDIAATCVEKSNLTINNG